MRHKAQPSPSTVEEKKGHTTEKAATSSLRDASLSPAQVQSWAPPAIFIQKYERVVDPIHLPYLRSERTHLIDRPEDNATPQPHPAHEAWLEAVRHHVKHSKTYETLVERLKEPPAGLFEPAVKADRSPVPPTIFVDEEKISPDILRSGPPALALKLPTDQAALDRLGFVPVRLNVRQLPTYYMMLSKSRLTLLVCATAAAGYAIAPGPFMWDTFLYSTLGTALFSSSANAINQYLEVPFDSQMNRTKNRVLVRGHVSTLHAMTFAAVTAGSGGLILSGLVNPVAAGLGWANLILYTCVYTPMKRVSILNTWVGSVVGAIPPMIGWASCTGSLEPGSLVLAGILYAWQFPHFNSLSWNLRPDYSKAGYRMMSVTDPDLCRRVALRYSLGCIAICTAAPWLEVTDPVFAFDSLPLNLILTYLSWKFYRNADSSSSRKLFRFTLIHLPLLMTLMFISKKRSSSKLAAAENKTTPTDS